MMRKISIIRNGLCSCFFMLAAVLLPCAAFSQTHAFRGKVADINRQPLPGVSVQVKGTQTGAATDAGGRFSVTAPPGATLVFSLMGYERQEIVATGTNELNITLQESSLKLTETVVVGYGTQKKVNLTGAVSVVSGEALAKRQVASTSLALQGTAPGVTVTQQSGAPGSDGATIRIRGLGSISAGQNPLVLVDNVPMSLDAIDPNNIENISILKDAAAAAIYGSRAANGVVLITTKRGRQGVSVNYSGALTWQKPTDLPEKVSALQHMKLWDQAQANSGLPPTFTNQIAAYEEKGVDNFTRFDTDWKKLVLVNDGLMHQHNVSIAAGSEKIKVFASGGYLDQNGVTANTNYKRTDIRFNTDMALTDNLTASADMVFNKSDRTWPGSFSPTAVIQYMLGLTPTAPGRYNTGEWGEGWANNNPAAHARDGGFDNQVADTRILTGTLRYKPIAGLELLGTYSSSYITARNRRLVSGYQIYTADPVNNKLVFVRAFPSPNSLSDDNAQTLQDLFRAQATWNKSWSGHQVTVLGGFSTETFKYTNVNASRINLISPTMPYLSAADQVGQGLAGGETRWSMASVYTRFNYNYHEKYLLELNGRWDASSRFRKENWWKLFPSASAGWRISEEDFWEPLRRYVNEAKVRVSYGSLGNQNVTGNYPTYALYSGGTAYNYYFNNVVNSGYALTTAANTGLVWETSTVLNAGLDLGFLKNRLTVTAEYFRRDIGDMLILDLVPAYVGLGAPYINIGSMRNTGWELGIGWRDKAGQVNYQVQLNLSDVKNTVQDIGGKEYINGAIIQKEGHALNSYYGYIADGLFQSAEEIAAAPFHFGNTAPGDIRYRDVSGPDGKPDGKIDANDRVVLGNSFPRYEYSLKLGADWKGIDLTVLVQGVGKRNNYLPPLGSQPFYSASYQGSIYQHQLDFWTPENKDATYPRLTNNSFNNNYIASSYWVRSGAYMRLKNIVLGYSLPAPLVKRIKMTSARIYASGQNLFTSDQFFPGFDPEQTDGGSNFYPIMKTYSVGLNVGF